MVWDSGTANHLLWVGTVFLAGCANLQLALTPEGTPHFALEEINGRILVIREEAYFVANLDTVLQVNDRIVSMGDSEALLQFTQTNERDEPLGEACQLRLPAAAQITLTSYRDCFDEEAVELNNVEVNPEDAGTSDSEA